MPLRAKNPGKKTLLPGTARLKWDVHFEMRSWKYIHMLSFVYEDGIKIKKYFATIQYMNFVSLPSNHQQASPVS
jgi:hypothetical protein